MEKCEAGVSRRTIGAAAGRLWGEGERAAGGWWSTVVASFCSTFGYSPAKAIRAVRGPWGSVPPPAAAAPFPPASGAWRRFAVRSGRTHGQGSSAVPEEPDVAARSVSTGTLLQVGTEAAPEPRTARRWAVAGGGSAEWQGPRAPGTFTWHPGRRAFRPPPPPGGPVAPRNLLQPRLGNRGCALFPTRG